MPEPRWVISMGRYEVTFFLWCEWFLCYCIIFWWVIKTAILTRSWEGQILALAGSLFCVLVQDSLLSLVHPVYGRPVLCRLCPAFPPPPLPPFFSIFIGFPDGSPSPTRYGWEEVLWQFSVSYNDTAARSSALTVRSPFLLRSLNGILVTYDGLTSHPRREAELLLKGISCHRNPDKLLCLTVKLNFWCLHLMISAFVFASEQLCKWRRLLSLFLLGCPWLWQDSSSRYLRPRLSSHSRGSAVWSVTAAKEDSPQWAY